MIRTVASVVFVLVACGPASAQIGFQQITNTHPVAVQRGTTSTIQVHSNFTLDDCYKVLFDFAGVELVLAETKPKEAPLPNRSAPGTPFAFKATVAADAPLGMRQFRCGTPNAVSSTGMLLVTDFPVSSEREPNNRAEQALEVPVPAAACGVIAEPVDVDFYQFNAKKGLTLVFECYAMRATEKIHNMVTGNQTYYMDSIVTVYDSSGREIAQGDDFHAGDSLLAHTFESDGTYTVSVRDVRFHGNRKYSYCLEISERPYVTSVFPMVVQAGKESELAIGGFNLGRDKTPFKASDTAGWISTSLAVDGKETNPVRLKVSDDPQVIESTDESPARFAIPSGLNGRIEMAGDSDSFVFQAKKGQNYWFEVEARRYGSKLDSSISIWEKDKRLAGNDDGPGLGKDSGLAWTATADGEFVLKIADLNGDGGEGFAYHVAAGVAQPDFRITGEFWYGMLGPGNHMMWFVRVARVNGFDGPIDFSIEGLPKGVTCEPLRLPANMTDASLILKAAPDAKVDCSLVRVVGTAKVRRGDGEAEIVRYGQPRGEFQSQGGGQVRGPLNTQIVGVVKKLDLVNVTARVGDDGNEISAKPGGKIIIDVEITRHADYAGKDVTLDMGFNYFGQNNGSQLPPGVRMNTRESKVRLTRNDAKGKIVLDVAADAPPIDRLPIAVMAQVSVTFSINTHYGSQPLYLSIKK